MLTEERPAEVAPLPPAPGAERAARAGRLGVYARDGALLGLFMVSACVWVLLLEQPASPVHALVPSAFARRAVVGAAMGLTALALIYSPWGKRTGALMNPATTLCFFRLGKLAPRDVLGFVVAQCAGGALGVLASVGVFGALVSGEPVRCVVTEPGSYGAALAWCAEFGISCGLLGVVLAVNRVPRLVPYGGCFAAALVALYITFEAPLSGMSMNPARSLASAVVAGSYRGLWIYFTAPVLGMLAAVEVVRRASGGRCCGKLTHDARRVCFLRCSCRPATELRAAVRDPGVQTP